MFSINYCDKFIRKIIVGGKHTPIQKERIQITNVKNERGNIVVAPMEIKKIIKEYHEQNTSKLNPTLCKRNYMPH